MWFAIHSAYICYDGLHSDAGNADIAIVPGNTVYADSSLSPWLKGRVDKALELYRQHRVEMIMVSGGPGEHGVPEGDAMTRYLQQNGVPLRSIINDNEGKNTYYTARDFLTLNQSMHFRSAIIVTSYYHITRAKYIFRKLGFNNIKAVASDGRFWSDAVGIVREFPALYKYMLVY